METSEPTVPQPRKRDKHNGHAHPTALGDPSNAAARAVAFEEPYVVTMSVVGTAALLFKRYNVDAVIEKGNARKGSKAKKEDDVESYVYRTATGELAAPGCYFVATIVNTARFRQDPRSPRKSAIDLFRAGVSPLTELCGLGVSEWDYLDRRRVTVQRSAIVRVRPAMLPGWRCTVELQVGLPEYIAPDFLHEVATLAGRVTGIGDFRPTFGRFQITGWTVAAC